MKTIMLAAAAVAALSLGSAAYAGEGEGGVTAGYQLWQTENGNATVPATQWFAEHNPASDGSQYAAVQPPFRASDGNGQG